jgi:hypothetical protein
MIMGTMKIDQVGSEILEYGKIARTTIDELTPSRSRSLRSDAPFKNEFAILAGVDARRFQQGIYFAGSSRPVELKDRLDTRRGGSRADDSTVGPFAEQELECSKDDRLPGTCLTRDRREAGRQIPFQLFNKSEITDAERPEHCRHEGDYAS